MLKYPALLLLLSWSAAAQDRYTLFQWERLQDDERIAVIARYIDTLATIATTERSQITAHHFTQCIMRSRLTPTELANYVREYVRARPELHGSSIQHAMDSYLDVLCGPPAN
jgi:hypothetical protein